VVLKISVFLAKYEVKMGIRLCYDWVKTQIIGKSCLSICLSIIQWLFEISSQELD